MGFDDFRLGLELVHKEVVAESEDCVLLGTVDFLEKGCSID